MAKIQTLWGDKTEAELLEAYDYLSYFYGWIEPYLERYIDDNPDVKIYKDQPIKQRCIEVYENQYKDHGPRLVPANYKKRFLKNG